MAKNSQSTRPVRGWIAGMIAAGVTGLLYASVFPLYRPVHYLIMGTLALGLGTVVRIMGSGLDTSRRMPAMNELPVTGDEAVDRLVSRGQEMLRAIREENDRIPDPVLSRQMDELEAIAGQIFRTVIEQPVKAPRIRRFMDYYLPTTLKMLTGYRRMYERGVSGENALQTRGRIESAMEVVLSAFKKQLDTLYQDDLLDISTDIDVLETMLRQDSLIPTEVSAGGRETSVGAQAVKEE